MAQSASRQLHHLRKVCRAFRLSDKAEAAGAWPSWPLQLLHGSQPRAYIAGAGASDRPPAFVFDIDGVLVRGNRVLDSAKRAFERLYKDGGQTPRYPVCFLTNGGGVTEEQKADELSSWLGVHVKENQVVLSHTPFKRLLPSLKGPVLVAGMGNVVEVAQHYGFKQLLTPLDVARADPSIAPFWKGRAGCAADSAKEGGQCPVKDLGYGSEEKSIKTVLVFKDPSDWYVDLQVITDICVGGGVIGKWKPEADADQAVKVYFSNPDLLFAGEYPAPRLGQGAFAAALRTLVREVTGRELNHEFMGKPNAAPYELAEQLLCDQAMELGLMDPQQYNAEQEETCPGTTEQAGAREHDSLGQSLSPFSAIYAVGDNPKADIAGALNARARGRPYVAMLVRTGVFSGERANDEEFPADVVVDDVDAAVQAALHRARNMRWHSMR